jgi:hypothetical protein
MLSGEVEVLIVKRFLASQGVQKIVTRIAVSCALDIS